MYSPSLTGIFVAGYCSTGGTVQTKYNHQHLENDVEVTRRHHPLAGQRFQVLRTAANFVVLQLADGSRVKMPKNWTNINDNSAVDDLCRGTIFTTTSILELLDLVQILSRR